jgi:peroxiredoxin
MSILDSLPRPALWIAALALLIIVGFFLFRDSGRNRNVNGVDVAVADVGEGDPAPDFTLQTVDGENVTLADFKGKVVMLNFWATWCPPCKAEIPDFITFQEQFGDKGFDIVGVALDKPAAIERFLARSDINYTIVVGDQATAALYGNVTSIPTTFLIDREGVIRHTAVGMRPREEWTAAIGKLLE